MRLKSTPERRKHERAYLPIAASLFTENARIGDYLVRDLSAGGALFTFGPAIPVGTPLNAILLGRGVEGLSIRCVARRSEIGPDGASNVAVEFRAVPPSIQDQIQKIVVRALSHENDPTVLVVHPKPLVLASLAGDLAELGRRVILATTRLETIRLICDLETTVEAILVDQSHDPNFGHAILEVVKEDFPAVRRIAMCEGTSKDEIARTLAAVEVNELLDIPWTPSGLEASLKRESRRTSQRSSSPSSP